MFYDGEPIADALARDHLLVDHLYTAARQQGMRSLEGVQAVLLESNGTFTVLSKSQYADGSAVESLR